MERFICLNSTYSHQKFPTVPIQESRWLFFYVNSCVWLTRVWLTGVHLQFSSMFVLHPEAQTLESVLRKHLTEQMVPHKPLFRSKTIKKQKHANIIKVCRRRKRHPRWVFLQSYVTCPVEGSTKPHCCTCKHELDSMKLPMVSDKLQLVFNSVENSKLVRSHPTVPPSLKHIEGEWKLQPGPWAQTQLSLCIPCAI